MFVSDTHLAQLRSGGSRFTGPGGGTLWGRWRIALAHLLGHAPGNAHTHATPDRTPCPATN